jgi:hypothetical protein
MCLHYGQTLINKYGLPPKMRGHRADEEKNDGVGSETE